MVWGWRRGAVMSRDKPRPRCTRAVRRGLAAMLRREREFLFSEWWPSGVTDRGDAERAMKYLRRLMEWFGETEDVGHGRD